MWLSLQASWETSAWSGRLDGEQRDGSEQRDTDAGEQRDGSEQRDAEAGEQRDTGGEERDKYV